MKQIVYSRPKIVIIDQQLTLKKFILLFSSIFYILIVNGQGIYNYREWGVGTDVSYIKGYTNITRQYNHAAVDASFFYNYSPYLPIAVELQSGQLSGGGQSLNLDPFGRAYTNNYFALILHADVHLGSMIDYEDDFFLNIVKNFYFGSGAGLVYNNNTVIRHPYYSPLYTFPGSDNSINLDIPFRFGYEFKLYDNYHMEPSMAFDIGYIHSIVFGSGLDGYNDPRDIFRHQSQDQYRQITIGFKYFFGNIVSYNKPIKTFR